MIERVYRRIRWFYPKGYLKWLEKNLAYTDISIGLERFLPLSFLYSFAFAVLVYSLTLILGYLWFSLVFLIVSLVGFQLIIDLFVILIGDKRGKFAENVLPDALQLMAGNIRSGLTPDKALLFTARPEFGMLEKEIKLAASKAVAGEPLEDALLSMGKRIKSKIIHRTFGLIVEGMRKGGEMASLLEQTSEDIRNLKLLKKEISAQVGMYAIFIFLAIGFAAPLLFGFSSYLVETMSRIGSTLHLEKAATEYTAVGSLKLSFVTYSTGFMKYYSLAVLGMTSVFGSLLIGLLQEGNEKAGIKYIPILLALDITIYILSRIIISQVTGIIAPAVTI